MARRLRAPSSHNAPEMLGPNSKPEKGVLVALLTCLMVLLVIVLYYRRERARDKVRQAAGDKFTSYAIPPAFDQPNDPARRSVRPGERSRPIDIADYTAGASVTWVGPPAHARSAADIIPECAQRIRGHNPVYPTTTCGLTTPASCTQRKKRAQAQQRVALTYY